MDGIQPYAGGPRPLVTVHPTGPSPASVKTPSDYLRAIRRRIWLALAVAIPIATAGTLYVLRMPATYLVTARIEIKAPKIDSHIAMIVTEGELSRGDATDEKYIPDTLAMLNDKGLAEETLRDQALGLPPSALEGDPGAELAAKIKTRQIPQSHLFDVTLDGRDPDRITRTLNLLLEKFRRRADRESRDANETAQSHASGLEKRYAGELEKLQMDLTTHVKNSTSLAPGGKNLTEANYETLRARLYYQQGEATAIRRNGMLETMRPPASAPVDSSFASKMAKLLEDKKYMSKRLAKARNVAVDQSDPAIKLAKRELDAIEEDMAALRDQQQAGPEGVSATDVYQSILEDAGEDIKATEGQLTTVLAAMKDAMPGCHRRDDP